MPQEKLDFSFLTKKIEEEIKLIVEKIISEEISTGKTYKYQFNLTDGAKISYHWYEFEIEAILPVVRKGSNPAGRMDVSFKVSIYKVP